MASPIVITGRKRDAILHKFERSEDDKRAKCKHCLWERGAVVERMKDHFEKPHQAEETEKPATSRQTKMETFVVKTSGTDKKRNEYECKVHSLVTDNHEQVAHLVTNISPDIIAYECGAH